LKHCGKGCISNLGVWLQLIGGVTIPVFSSLPKASYPKVDLGSRPELLRSKLGIRPGNNLRSPIILNIDRY
jgi:hypothetical protein